MYVEADLRTISSAAATSHEPSGGVMCPVCGFVVYNHEHLDD